MGIVELGLINLNYNALINNHVILSTGLELTTDGNTTNKDFLFAGDMTVGEEGVLED